MTRSAIVDGGVVASVIVGQAPDAIPCPDDVSPGWSYDGASFSPPGEAAATAAFRDRAKADFATHLQALATTLTGPVPDAERASWADKQGAASAYLDALDGGAAHADALDACPLIGRQLLEAESTVTGEDFETLCRTVEARAQAFAVAAGILAAHRKMTLAAVDALPETATPSEVRAVVDVAKANVEVVIANLA